MDDVKSVQDLFDLVTGSYVRSVQCDFLRCDITIVTSKNLDDVSPRHFLKFSEISVFQFVSSYSGRMLPQYSDEEDEDNHIELIYIGLINSQIVDVFSDESSKRIKPVPPNIYIELNSSPVYISCKYISYDSVRFSIND